MKLEQLFIKEAAEKGIEMKIRLPDGKIIEESLTVLGSDSETFLGELAKMRKDEVELVGKRDKLTPAEYAKAEKELRSTLISSLVTGWTFEEKFSREAVKHLFEQAPYIRDQVDSFAAKRSNFFKMPSADC